MHQAFLELIGQGTVGSGGFAEDNQAGSFLVKAMNDGQPAPARLAIFEPFIQALAGEGRRRMGAPTGWFFGDKQMFVFKNNQVHIEQDFIAIAKRTVLFAWFG